MITVLGGFTGSSACKEPTCNAGDPGSIPGLGISPGEGKGNPLQYSCLENSMGCIVHGVTKSQTRLSNFHFTKSTRMWWVCETDQRLVILCSQNQSFRQGERWSQGHDQGYSWVLAARKSMLFICSLYTHTKWTQVLILPLYKDPHWARLGEILHLGDT